MDLNTLPSLAPLAGFELQVPIHKVHHSPSLQEMKRSHLLPLLGPMLGEETFADLALVVMPEGIDVALFVAESFVASYYPNYQEGDALELFFATRDVKNSGVMTKFCHHFLFLPEKVSGTQNLELTRLRAEDAHPLCDPHELVSTLQVTTKGYSLRLQIPSTSLCGYDFQTQTHLAFTYKIHRHGGKPQHFAVSSCDYAVEQYPRLWTNLIFE